MFNKPTFGQPTTTGGFGAPFGQTTMFGKTQTTGFAQPAFGTSGSTGLFGNTMPTSNTLFGPTTAAPSFGQAPSTSFGFGATQQPATNLFGSQPTTGTGLFGATPNTFGQAKPAFGSTFGTTQTTGLFASQQPAQPAAPLFGSTAQQATPFGATSAFGATAQPTGSVIKFNPITGTDTLQKGSSTQQINTRFFCISCMKEYEGKSLEEIRYEDYLANRKGPQQGTGLFGQTQQQPSLFGATTATSGIFGAQPTENKSLFGTTATTLGGFGTSGGSVFSSQPASSTSLFAAKPTGFGTTTTSTPGFGFGANTGTTGLFGSAPTTQTAFGATSTPSLFGQTTTQPTTAFGATTGFGTNFGAQQNQSIGLFGAQNKPATGFNLGSTAPTTGFNFGQTTTAGTGLFGAKPATTGFGTTGFGTTGSTFGAATSGASLFNKPATSAYSFGGGTTALGGTNLNTSTNLFGSTQPKPGGLFGTAPSTGLFGSTGSTFGNTGTTFGAPNTGLGGSTLGAPSMFGSTLAPAPAAPAPAHSAFLALASLPFANSPLYKSLLPATRKTDSQTKTNTVLTPKIAQVAADLKVSPQSDTKVKLKSHMWSQAKKSIFEGLDDTPPVSLSTSSVRTLKLKPKDGNQSLTEVLSDSVGNKENRRVSFSLPLETPHRENNRDNDTFYIRRNPLFKTQSNERQTILDDLEPAASSTIVEEANKEADNQESVDDEPNTSNKNSFDETHGFLNETSQVDEDWVPHPTGIILRRVDYFTIPSLDELQALVAEDGSCVVENFCIGRYDYGNLYFDETMDVAGLDIDGIVHFRHKEVTVYPDETNKPEIGQGLNRKCQVTLEQVWPVDKKTRELITDPQELADIRYVEKLKRCTAKMKANFVEYRPLSGSWVFKVDHFSKYGLNESEDEEDAPPKPPPKKLPIPPVAGRIASTPMVAQKSMAASVILSPITPPKQQCFSLADSHSVASGTTTFHDPSDKPLSHPDLSLDVDMDDEEEVDEGVDMLDSPWSLMGNKIDSHRVQLMKSSLFHSHAAEDELEELTRLRDASAYASNGAVTMTVNLPKQRLSAGMPVSMLANETFDMGRTFLSPVQIQPLPILLPRPKVVSLSHADSVIPYKLSTIGKTGTRFIADCGLMKGRSFRVGWGPFSTITCLTTQREASRSVVGLGNRHRGDFSSTLIQQLSLYPTDSIFFGECIEKHLQIQLEHSLRGDDDGCPVMSPAPGHEALHRHSLLAADLALLEDSFLVYSKEVWGLCSALWGALPTLSPDNPTSHEAIMMRKEALTEWLRNCAEPLVEMEAGVRTDQKAIFARLTGHGVSKACEISQNKGEHYAALLLCSGQSAKKLMQDQLREWADVNADRFIQQDRLKIFAIAAGLPVAPMSNELVNICNGLDWRRVFALHNWYTCSPVASISDVVARYEAAFSGDEPYADPPHPPYCYNVQTTSGRLILDLCFHLLKLFSSRSHPLESLLNPATYTADPLDYRLSWLLEQTLSSLGYSHVSPLASSISTVSFAAQLEAHGLWHWGIFVLLHLKDSTCRKQAVIEYLNRHVVLMDGREFSTEEEFIVEHLGIAAEWIFSAKSVLALSRQEYNDAAHYLLQACEWNNAHEVIITHIAPDLVINEEYVILEEFLERLGPHEREIAEWPNQGQLLLDYLDIKRSVKQALDEQDAGQIESRLPQLASVCQRVVKWPTPTVKHRLCQAEIAKGTARIYLTVKQSDNSESALRDARALITKLPLPADYLLEELELIRQAELALETSS